MKLYEQSPEDEIVRKEDMVDLINRASSLLSFFFKSDELNIYLDHLAKTPIRAMAMQHRMSRYNIRKKCRNTAKKIEHFRSLISL